MRYDLLLHLQRWLARLALIALLLAAALVGLAVQRGTLTLGGTLTGLGRLTGLPNLPRWQVAIVAGHRGFDSGAVCEDGLTEVSITTAVAAQTAQGLRARQVFVQVLDEYDPRLQGLRSEALISIHVDSCVPLSGFKVSAPATSDIPAADERLRGCLEQAYAAATGLAVHAATITEDMTGYHAFQRMAGDTPGAIIEIGFLGGDRLLLTEEQPRIVTGIVDGVICFLQGE